MTGCDPGEALRRALAALPEERFEAARAVGQSGALRWLPLARAPFRSGGHESRVGPDREGGWWVESANALLPVAPGAPVPPLLGWLEHDPDEVRRTLAAGLEAAGLPPGAADGFPLDTIVEFGLRTTEHWTHHALRWLDDGVAITRGVAGALGVLLREEALPAATRLRVAALVQRRSAGH